MEIKKLCFENFRNLQDGFIEPDGEINVIFGDNAQGKTNLLEAIWLFAGGHSFRGNKDHELPRLADGKNVKNASLRAEFISEERPQWAVLHICSGRRSSVINGVEKKTGSALVGKICAVIFSPEHLLLIKDGPGGRRSFVDGAICQINPSYPKLLMRYNRVIVQRNALLREMQVKTELSSMLEIWNERAVHFGTEIMQRRIAYVEALSGAAKEVYAGISGNRENFRISYRPLGMKAESFGENSLEHYNAALVKSEKSDIRLGITSVGPHRDDVEIEIDGLSARTYGSQGQQRSAVIAMKLAEADVLQKNIGESPLILLDDVMSELDKSRQDYILNRLYGRQIFVTCCSPETVNLMEKGKKYRVSQGAVTCEAGEKTGE